MIETWKAKPSINVTKQWHVIYTHSGCEKKVSEVLARKKIEYFLPVNRIVDKATFWKGILTQPLFPSFIFIRVANLNPEFLKQIPGVMNVVYWLKQPAVIKDSEIELIKHFLKEHKTVHLEKVSVNAEEMILRSISKTPKDGAWQRDITEIFLPSLGYVLSAEISKAHPNSREELNYIHPFSYKSAL